MIKVSYFKTIFLNVLLKYFCLKYVRLFTILFKYSWYSLYSSNVIFIWNSFNLNRFRQKCVAIKTEYFLFEIGTIRRCVVFFCRAVLMSCKQKNCSRFVLNTKKNTNSEIFIILSLLSYVLIILSRKIVGFNNIRILWCVRI